MACDFFSVDTVALKRLYVLFFIHHETRRAFLAGITTNPTWDWVALRSQVSTDLRDAGISVTHLLRDRDGKFGRTFDSVWEGEGASVVRTPVRGPDANAVAERRVRTVRSECTDRLLIVNDGHLHVCSIAMFAITTNIDRIGPLTTDLPCVRTPRGNQRRSPGFVVGRCRAA